MQVQLPLFASPARSLPEGFSYCPDVISADEEKELLAEIAPLPFQEFQFHGFEGKRRVVSFGWRYDFSEHKALPAPEIPPFLRELCRKVQAASGFALDDLQQILVTEYAAGAPIGWHKDRPVFGNVMAFRWRRRAPFGFESPPVTASGSGSPCFWNRVRRTYSRVPRAGLGSIVSRRWMSYAIRSRSEIGGRTEPLQAMRTKRKRNEPARHYR
jgi:hypothetical protein